MKRRPKPIVSDRPCIYTSPRGLCSGIDPINDEHALPVAFGQFEHDPPLRKICVRCNERFGKLDEILSRNSPEALHRLKLGVTGRRSHRKSPILYEGTMGLPPLAIRGSAGGGDSDVLWGPTGETKFDLLTQVQVQRPDGTKVWFAVSPNVRDSADLVGRLSRAGHSGAEVVRFRCPPEDRPRMLAICGFENKTLRVAPHSEEERWVQTSVRFRFDDRHFLGIAKIAFHLFLGAFDGFSGFESEFDGIKQFIYRGERGALYPWVRTAVGREPLINRTKITSWGHAALVAYDRHSAEVRLEFFLSPKMSPIAWDVRIAEKLEVPDAEERRGFLYLADGRSSKGYIGKRIEMPTALVKGFPRRKG